jgi:hypothetical protein
MKLLRRLSALFGFSLMLSCLNVGGSPTWPDVAGAQTDESVDADVRSLPVCVASRSWSAGELGRSILYRYKREGRTMTVGYFVYWSTERPWGKNALSYSVLPALFIDAFYSHFFFMFPGAQRFIHGPGDIEGARVVYEQQDDGKWMPVSAVGSDGFHNEVPLSTDDFVDAEGRVVLMTDVWSHQLGAKGASAFERQQKDSFACYGGDSMSPLTDEIARIFRLGSPSDARRAGPAWRLDLPPARVAITSQAAVQPTPDRGPLE